MKATNHQFIFYDVDDTLIMWDLEQYSDLEDVYISDPYMDEPETYHFKKHKSHIEWLIRMHKRGEKIVVWSAGGQGWAQAVVDALGIGKYVDYVLGKPTCIYDDESPKNYMPPNRWNNP